MLRLSLCYTPAPNTLAVTSICHNDCYYHPMEHALPDPTPAAHPAWPALTTADCSLPEQLRISPHTSCCCCCYVGMWCFCLPEPCQDCKVWQCVPYPLADKLGSCGDRSSTCQSSTAGDASCMNSRSSSSSRGAAICSLIHSSAGPCSMEEQQRQHALEFSALAEAAAKQHRFAVVAGPE